MTTTAPRATHNTPRDGTALVLALLLVVVTECVIIGVLQLASQQRRIAASALNLLELRLAAENAVRRSLAEWPRDSIGMGPSGALRTASTADGLDVHIRFERLEPDLVVVTADAVAPASRPGRYSASALAHPPLLHRSHLLAAAASSLRIDVADGASITAGPAGGCTDPAELAARTNLLLASSAAITGAVASDFDPDASPVRRTARNVRGVLSLSADSTIADFAGVIVSDAAVTVRGGGHVSGVIIAQSVHVEDGALVSGSVYATRHLLVSGSIHGNPCAVRQAVRAARLEQATRVPGRAWIPAF